MKKAQEAKTKSGKPFLAARIPPSLELALESHVDSTGESKTQTVINALGAYLKWSDKEKSVDASNRLSILERKVAELESLLKTPQQTSFLDISSVIKSDNAYDNKIEESKADNSSKSVIAEDNGGDNKAEILEPIVGSVDSSRLMTHRELSELTGKNYNSVKSRARNENKEIEFEGKTFKFIQTEGKPRWKEITDNDQ